MYVFFVLKLLENIKRIAILNGTEKISSTAKNERNLKLFYYHDDKDRTWKAVFFESRIA